MTRIDSLITNGSTGRRPAGVAVCRSFSSQSPMRCLQSGHDPALCCDSKTRAVEDLWIPWPTGSNTAPARALQGPRAGAKEMPPASEGVDNHLDIGLIEDLRVREEGEHQEAPADDALHFTAKGGEQYRATLAEADAFHHVPL